MARNKALDRSWLSALQSILSPYPPPSPWDPPSLVYALLHFPIIYMATLLYRATLFLRPLPTTDSWHPIQVVTISDTHDKIWPDIPSGDLLIHAGDLTNKGTVADLQKQIDWLKSLPHPHKIVIAGNHDTYLDPRSRKTLLHSETVPDLDWGGVRYLQHSSVELDFSKRGGRKLKIYAAPQIPAEGHPDWAFTYPRSTDAWTETVPNDIDILVTHGPPQFHLDIFGLGCQHLLNECWRIKPKLHVFGHAHSGAGYETVFWDESQRAYELLCRRCRGVGFWHSILSIFNWLHLMRMVLYGLKGIMWCQIWGGKDNPSAMINTSLSYQSTGLLGNEPQVALI